MHMLSCFSYVRLLLTLGTVAQAPLSERFSRQQYWSGLPCPPPADLPDPGIEPASITSPELAGEFFTTSATWEAQQIYTTTHKINNKFSTLKPIMEKNLKKKIHI